MKMKYIYCFVYVFICTWCICAFDYGGYWYDVGWFATHDDQNTFFLYPQKNGYITAQCFDKSNRIYGQYNVDENYPDEIKINTSEGERKLKRMNLNQAWVIDDNEFGSNLFEAYGTNQGVTITTKGQWPSYMNSDYKNYKIKRIIIKSSSQIIVITDDGQEQALKTVVGSVKENLIGVGIELLLNKFIGQ